MTEKKQIAVWFNEDMKRIHEGLVIRGLTTMKFQDFVKTAFHEKADSLNIEKLTLEQLQKNNVKR